jgi:hypothetical protein
MGFLLPLLPYLAAAALALGAVWSVVSWLDGRGYERCQVEHEAATAEAERQAHEHYLGALAWGNQVSADLAKKQRELDTLKGEYLTYANAIVGNCPADLGLFVASVAAGDPVPSTPRTPPDPSAAIAASAIAANVATNYGIARNCEAQLNALIDWHTRPQKDVK